LRQVVQRLMTSPDRLDLLATDGPHGTMRSVFSWSYASLPDTAARAFRRLGHHPGPDISLAAASALLGCPNATARAILGVLTGVHLLTEKDIDRYEFHDLLREYARECAEADEASAARTAAADRILTWYLLTARNGANRLSPGSPPYVVISAPPDCHPQDFASASEALAWFETERANLVAAVTEARRSGRSDIAWQLAVSISPFLYQHGHWDDWISTQEVGLAAAEEQGDDMAEARMLSGLGGALGELHRYEPAKRLLERALSIRRRLNDRSGAAYVLANLATLDRDLGCLDTAIHRLQEVEATFRADLDDFGLTYTLINIGELYLAGNELNAARTALTEAVELSRKHHNYFAEGCALDFLGRVHSRTGDLDGAELLLSKALTIRLDLDDRRGAATTLAHLAQVHELAGNLRKADHCRRRARALAEFLGHSSPVETNAEYAKPLTHPLRPGYNALRSAVVIRHGDGP
jgi:tetratricopeptide (TPR) repeat protein